MLDEVAGVTEVAAVELVELVDLVDLNIDEGTNPNKEASTAATTSKSTPVNTSTIRTERNPLALSFLGAFGW